MSGQIAESDVLRQVIAVKEITDAKARYLRGLDTHDWEMFRSAFTADATLEGGEFQFGRDPVTGARTVAGTVPEAVLEGFTIDEPVVGVDQIVAFVRSGMEGRRSSHAVYAPEMSIENDTATVVWAMRDYVWFPPGGEVSVMHGFGHYHETYERTGAGWRIKYLRLSRLRVEWH